jgi:hypothetical protein
MSIVYSGRALHPALPEHERAERLHFGLARAKVEAAMLSSRRPDDRRFAQLALVLGELAQSVFYEDDPVALAGAAAWAERRQKVRGRLVVRSATSESACAVCRKPIRVGAQEALKADLPPVHQHCSRENPARLAGRGVDLRTLAANARARLLRHAAKKRSRIQAAWLLSRALGEIVAAYLADDRRKWVSNIYAAMPLGAHGRGVDRDKSKKREPFTADPTSAVKAALRALGVDKKTADHAFAAEDMARARATKRRRRAAKT